MTADSDETGRGTPYAPAQMEAFMTAVRARWNFEEAEFDAIEKVIGDPECAAALSAVPVSEPDDNSKFWLELREPNCVPERKGPFRVKKTAEVLREFVKARPQAMISVVTIGYDGPWFEDAPTCLMQTDGRSTSTASAHIKSSNAAHASPVAQEPVAWVEFTEAGLIRFWTDDPARAEIERTKRSLTKFNLSELIALVGLPRTPPATPAGLGADEIADAITRAKDLIAYAVKARRLGVRQAIGNDVLHRLAHALALLSRGSGEP